MFFLKLSGRYLHIDGVWRDSCKNESGENTGYFDSQSSAWCMFSQVGELGAQDASELKTHRKRLRAQVAIACALLEESVRRTK